MHCYAPTGTSGAFIQGRAGEEAQSPGWFAGNDPAKRIVSVAIVPNLPTTVNIYALRSDGLLFQAQTFWPNGPDPRIFFSPVPGQYPANLRSIAFVVGVGLVGVTTDNQVFQQSGLNWTVLGTSNVVLVAGNASSIRKSLALVGTSGLSTLVGNVQPGDFFPPSLPTLPNSLPLGLADPNASFNQFGRTSPIAVGVNTAYALVPGNCPSGSLTPCIVTSQYLPSVNIWLAWQSMTTGNISSTPGYPMPWTIQDGSIFRGVSGELWVIAGFEHLAFWAP